MVVGWEKVDKAEATSREQAQIKLDIEERREQVLRQKQKQNNSSEVVMLPTTADLKDALDAFAGCSGIVLSGFPWLEGREERKVGRKERKLSRLKYIALPC